ncbi:MAG: signal peptidase I [Patescibacteria group bacterium]
MVMDEYKEENSNAEDLNRMEATANPASDFLYFLFDLLKTGLIVFLLALSLRYFAIQPFIVDGESMMPSFVNNEYLLAEKVNYLIKEPKRGDAVVFRYPGNPNINYIKRIIGLPGETIKISKNQVTVVNNQHPDGVVLQEVYLSPNTKTYVNESDEFKKEVGDGEYFVMGDNRQHSSDSREWGVLPRKNIIGRAWLTILPVDRFQLQRRLNYSQFGFIQLLPKILAGN